MAFSGALWRSLGLCGALCSTVQRFNGLTVQRLNGSTVQRFNGSTVQLFNGSMVQRFNGSTIQLFNGSTVQRWGRILRLNVVKTLKRENVRFGVLPLVPTDFNNFAQTGVVKVSFLSSFIGFYNVFEIVLFVDPRPPK